MVETVCSIDGCKKLASGPRGWCWGHYQKWRRYGDPNSPTQRVYVSLDPMQRILSKLTVDLSTNCWLYAGSKTRNGYGHFYTKDKPKGYAHVFMYEQIRGSVPDGHNLHHICRQRHCVNPWHLEPMIPQEHLRLHHFKGKPEFCTQGHEMTPDNTLTVTRKSGKRAGTVTWFCRECDSARKRLRREGLNAIIDQAAS